MKRREFITLLGGAAAAWPLAARAQQPAMLVPRLGILTQGAASSPFESAFRQGLRDFGFVEGQNLVVEFRDASGQPERLLSLALELVNLKIDVIFTAGSEATSAARQATSLIPIVMTSSNPVGLGFVANLARPGGNITGLSIMAPELSGKRLALLKEVTPGIAKVAVIWNPDDPSATFSLQETQAAAKTQEVKLQILEARRVEDFEGSFLTAKSEGAEAVIALPAPLMSRNGAQIADLALRNRLPTMLFSDQFAKAGGLISYGPNLVVLYRRAAYYVDRILKGAKPAELPIEQPTKYELVINLKTAKTLGLVVPPTLLALADEVIE
jgi:putative tryptophan/tyrosine transport system substrate-binding protein